MSCIVISRFAAFGFAVYSCAVGAVDNLRRLSKYWLYQAGTVMVISSSMTFLEFVALLALCASPDTRCEWPQDAIWWFDGVFIEGVPVTGDNVF